VLGPVGESLRVQHPAAPAGDQRGAGGAIAASKGQGNAHPLARPAGKEVTSWLFRKD